MGISKTATDEGRNNNGSITENLEAKVTLFVVILSVILLDIRVWVDALIFFKTGWNTGYTYERLNKKYVLHYRGVHTFY